MNSHCKCLSDCEKLVGYNPSHPRWGFPPLCDSCYSYRVDEHAELREEILGMINLKDQPWTQRQQYQLEQARAEVRYLENKLNEHMDKGKGKEAKMAELGW